jgi:phospholipid/cholesterol/gamma-HCH transport system permease protein
MATVNQIASGAVRSGRNTLESYGDQFLFYVKALSWAPRAIKRYPREVSSALAKRAAGDDAWDTPGVVDVSNQLQVVPATSS